MVPSINLETQTLAPILRKISFEDIVDPIYAWCHEFLLRKRNTIQISHNPPVRPVRTRSSRKLRIPYFFFIMQSFREKNIGVTFPQRLYGSLFRFDDCRVFSCGFHVVKHRLGEVDTVFLCLFDRFLEFVIGITYRNTVLPQFVCSLLAKPNIVLLDRIRLGDLNGNNRGDDAKCSYSSNDEPRMIGAELPNTVRLLLRFVLVHVGSFPESNMLNLHYNPCFEREKNISAMFP
nr:MAG TPA: hypothetical protein [Caudoviricetes sp.]